MKYRCNELVAIFLTACATLLFQVTATKIFEFSLWANYAYLVISTAMFGLGLSGVILTVWPKLLNSRDSVFLATNTLFSGITMFLAFLAVNFIPIHLPDAPDGWLSETINVAIVFMALGVPFIFFGLAITFIFHHRGQQANVYYFADLIGAGIGSFILVPLISSIEPQGLVVLSCLTAVFAAALFMLSAEKRSFALLSIVFIICAGSVVTTIMWAPKVAEQIPLNIHVKKRTFYKDLARGKIDNTGWSTLSRVDIANENNGTRRVWIAGGVNESAIVEFDGDFEKLRKRRKKTIKQAEAVLDHKALPHLLKKDHTVCMIGTSGGEDSLYALAMGARKVVGVEMDPMIAKFVTETYRDYAGGLFTDGDYSELVIDEGRSYLRGTDRKFDVIQQVNNFTPIAFQNGALNLSETYLLTAESFKDFYDHLTDDGILSISRYGSIRMMTTAVEMFRRMGMKPEEYSKHMVVCQGSQWVINTFMLKKSPFTEEEIEELQDFYSAGKHNRELLYAPYITEELRDLDNNLYHKIATAEDPSPYWRLGCFNFSPTTDQKPFFNRFKVLGLQDRGRGELAMLPGEIKHIEPKNKVDSRIPQGDLPPLIILLEALLLSTVFFGIPMAARKDLRATLAEYKWQLGYFACLGISFIFVEICLIQKLVLFLGAPVYSIATVLCSLLIFAGFGSLCSGFIKASTRNIKIMLTCVAGAVLATHFIMPTITDQFLGKPLTTRIMISLIFTGGAGFMMGMPMPTGIRFLKETGKPIIPWAWAANGYFTVTGSALSVLIAANFGFTAVFAISALLYVAAPFFLKDK